MSKKKKRLLMQLLLFFLFLQIRKNQKLIENFVKSDGFYPIASLVFLMLYIPILLVFMVKLFKYLRKSGYKITFRELLLAFLTLLVAGIAAAFVVVRQNQIYYFLYFAMQIHYQIVRTAIGAGIFCGFMTAAKLGYFYYWILVPRLVFDNYEDSFFFEHHQKRVAAITSFVTGQLLMFTSVYNRPLHIRLVQADNIFMLFLIFFLFQLLWTYFSLVRNWRFLYPNDKRKRVVRRVILLQLEFMVNFFLQLSLLPYNAYIQKDSLVRTIVNMYLKGKYRAKKIWFVRSSFVGWLIGHIFFMIFYLKLFKFLVILTIWLRNWVRNSFSDKGKK